MANPSEQDPPLPSASPASFSPESNGGAGNTPPDPPGPSPVYPPSDDDSDD